MDSTMFFDYPNPGGKKAMKYTEVLVWVALFHVENPFLAKDIRDFINKNQRVQQLSTRQVDCAIRIFRTMNHVEVSDRTWNGIMMYCTTVKFRRFRRNK
jgi:hypothetical protein